MAEIDVSDLLTDPDFVDTFDVIRRKETVVPGGRPTFDTTIFKDVVGSVQPASGRMLRQLPDAARVEGAIEVYTTFELAEQTKTTTADGLIWAGQQYIVTRLDPWQNFGNGYTHAVCTLQRLVGPELGAENTDNE